VLTDGTPSKTNLIFNTPFLVLETDVSSVIQFLQNTLAILAYTVALGLAEREIQNNTISMESLFSQHLLFKK
jgi:hypothetical protein